MSSSEKGFVLEPEAAKMLSQYQIPYPEHRLARSRAEAVGFAAKIGYPVVLKIVSPQVVHKSEAGGVALGLADAAAVSRGYDDMIGRIKASFPQAQIEGVLLCHQAPEGLEVIVGGLHDPVFGPTVMFGLGGIFAEVFKDVTFRVAPLKPIDAEEMIAEVKGYPLLEGVRGQSPRDLDALAELLLAVSRLLAGKPDLKELDLNPVRLYQKGLLALDVRVIEKN